MEAKDAFDEFLDVSLQVLRKHLAAAHENAKAHATSRALAFEGDLQLLANTWQRLPETRTRSDSKASELVPPSPRSASSASPSEAASIVRFGEDTRIEIPAARRPSAALFPEATLDAESDDEDEAGKISHGDSSALLQSDLRDLTESERRLIRHRLRVRLGFVSKNRLVSGKSLHDSLSALGLTRYTEQDVNDLINHLATFINLSFEAEEDTMWSGNTLSSLDIFGLRGFDPESAKPVWQWPVGSPANLRKEKSAGSLHREKSTFSIYKDSSSPDIHMDAANLVEFNVVPLEALMDVFLSHEGSMHKKIFGPKLLKQFRAVKEILPLCRVEPQCFT